jgi:hypothetical protein
MALRPTGYTAKRLMGHQQTVTILSEDRASKYSLRRDGMTTLIRRRQQAQYGRGLAKEVMSAGTGGNMLMGARAGRRELCNSSLARQNWSAERGLR